MLSLDPASLNSCARFQWVPCTSHPLPILPFLTKPRGPLFPELISFKRKKICRLHFGDWSSLAKACAALSLSLGRVCGLSGEAGGSLLPTPPPHADTNHLAFQARRQESQTNASTFAEDFLYTRVTEGTQSRLQKQPSTTPNPNPYSWTRVQRTCDRPTLSIPGGFGWDCPGLTLD